MPIKNLQISLIESGKIKIGRKGKVTESEKGKEFRLPEKLDHFVITTTYKNDSGDFVLNESLMEDVAMHESVCLDANEKITGIPIRLLYNDTELNFPHRYNSFPNGKLNCYGDGEVSFKARNDEKFKIEHPCPCKRSEPGYSGKDKCKPTGTLTCIIDGSEYFGQAHKFRTTSINSIKGIVSGIELIKAATRGMVAGLPLMLMVTPKSTIIPNGGATTVYVVSICYRGSMEDLQNKTLELMQNDKQLLLGMNEIEEEARKSGFCQVVAPDEVDDYNEEFNPDAIKNVTPEHKSVNPDTTNSPKTLQSPTEIQKITGLNPEEWKEEHPEDPDGIEFLKRVNPGSDKTRSDEEIKKEEPQLDLLRRLNRETDREKAVALSKRLNKEYLIKWLVNTYCKSGLCSNEDLPPGTAKKTIFTTFASSWIRKHGVPLIDESQEKKKIYADPLSDPDSPERQELKDKYADIPEMGPALGFYKHIDLCRFLGREFKGTPINRTLGFIGLLELAKHLYSEGKQVKRENVSGVDDIESIDKPEKLPEKKETKTLQDQDCFKWDDGPESDRYQHLTMVSLKKEKAIDTPIWIGLVSKYSGSDGEPMKTATNMTHKQASHFMNNIDDIPF